MTNQKKVVLDQIVLDVLPHAIADAMHTYHHADAALRTAKSKTENTTMQMVAAFEEAGYGCKEYLISPTTAGSLCTPRMYADFMTICTALLPAATQALIGINPDTLSKFEADGETPNAKRVAVMNARKQPPSKLKDLRNAAIKVWKARELEAMTADEKDAASEDAQRTKAIEAFNKGVKYSADCIDEDGHAEIAALVKQIMVHLNC
tara:strand:+ start:133 stop:750 length:618 start_codon:yes stop_codon:yes gene_type:complete